MPTYRQTISYYEDGYGIVKKDYIVSDTYDGLFTDDYLSVDILTVSKVKMQREKSLGQLAQNEADFSIDESTFNSDDEVEIIPGKTQRQIDKDLLNLCIQSEKGSHAYVGIFINASASPVFSEAIFLGVVNPKEEWDDRKWNGTEFGTLPSPVRKYDFNCEPQQEATFEEESLSEAIDSTTLQLDVFDGEGHYKTENYESRVGNLLNLNTALHKIKDSYANLLNLNGHGAWTFTFTTAEVDGEFTPVRWTNQLAEDIIGHFVRGELQENGVFQKKITQAWGMYSDDPRQMYLVHSNPSYTGDDVFFINAANIIKQPNTTDDRQEYDEEIAENHLWQNIEKVDDSFTNLLYAIATELGMYVKFNFVNQREIEIQFQSKNSISQGQKVWIRDVEKASGERYQVEKREESRKSRGLNGYLMAEGYDEVDNSLNPHFAKESEKKKERSEGFVNLLGIGATLWTINNDKLKAWGGVNRIIAVDQQYNSSELLAPAIPMNTFLSDSAGNKLDTYAGLLGNAVPYNSQSLCKNLFMKVNKRIDEDYSPNTYYTHIGLFGVKRDGIERQYTELRDYTNSFNEEDLVKYGNKYKLTIPYLMSASTSSNGSNPSIFNLKVDNLIDIGALEYVIDTVEIDLEKHSVDLELSTTGRFSTSSIVFTGKTKNNSVQSSEDSGSSGAVIENHVMNTSIKAGEFVSRVTSTNYERALPTSDHYGRIIGVAINDAEIGETVSVQTSGVVNISWLSGSVNDAVYLRNVSAVQNLSTSPLTEKNNEEDLYAEVGRIVNTNKMEINIKEHFVLT